MKKVLILYKFLPQYRVEFFDKLRDALLKEGVELQLIYGKLKNKDAKKNDERDLPWAEYRESKVIKLGSTELLWQPSLDKAKKVDLVIVEQANKLLINYILILLSKVTPLKFAFWGHGMDMQNNPKSLKNRFKYFFLTHSDYWFAYTQGVKKLLVKKGVEPQKVTVVDNAIDTTTLKKQYDEYPQDDLNKVKIDLGINSDNVGLYCGGIYSNKRIDFLLEAAQIIRKQVPDFHIVFVGAGADQYKLENATKQYDWIHYVGPKFGMERVPYFKLSKLFLMPGLVGLAILDTFATMTPMVTTEYPFHSPEIEYLKNKENGLMTQDDVALYAKEVINLLINDQDLDKLKMGCLESSSLYSTEKMVQNFKNGIVTCLDL
jgi:glycosyltransferase involved in cell wall biosynthesis